MMLFADAHLDDATVKERKLPPPLGKGVGGERGRDRGSTRTPFRRQTPWRRPGGLPQPRFEAHQADQLQEEEDLEEDEWLTDVMNLPEDDQGQSALEL